MHFISENGRNRNVAVWIIFFTVLVVVIKRYKCKKTYQFKTHCKDDAMMSLH